MRSDVALKIFHRSKTSVHNIDTGSLFRLKQNNNLHDVSHILVNTAAEFCIEVLTDHNSYIYRPQTKFEKVILSQVSVHRGCVSAFGQTWADTP